MGKTLFFINPVAGGRAGAGLRESLEKILRDTGMQDTSEIAFTTAEGPLACAGKLSEYETVIAAGGDGTVSRIVQELAACPGRPRLGIIPLGTGNDLARVSGAYRRYRQQGLRGLVPALRAGTARGLDVFSINDRIFFTNYCGIGIDAKISNDYNQKRHSRLMRRVTSLLGPRAAYVWFTAANLASRLPFSLALSYTDAQGHQHALPVSAGACQVLITAIPSYAAGARPCASCSLDDALFEITIIQTLLQWFVLHMTRFLPQAFTRRRAHIKQLQAAHCSLRFEGAPYFQADGELYAGTTESCRGLTIKHAGSLELVFV